MDIDEAELLRELNIEALVEPVVEEKEVIKLQGGLQVSITEITVTVKINPKGLYSPSETSMTLSIQGADKTTKEGIKKQLQQEVITYTIDTVKEAVKAAKQAELL